MRKELQKYEPYVVRWLHTGSTVITPKEFQKDEEYKPGDDDWLALSYIGGVKAFERLLTEDGWVLGGSLDNDSNPLQEELERYDGEQFSLQTNTGWIGAFHSYKKDDLNVIVTVSQEYFNRFKRATDLARQLSLTDKLDRVTLFEAIVWGKYPEFEDYEEEYVEGKALFGGWAEGLNRVHRVHVDIEAIQDRNNLLVNPPVIRPLQVDFVAGPEIVAQNVAVDRFVIDGNRVWDIEGRF